MKKTTRLYNAYKRQYKAMAKKTPYDMIPMYSKQEFLIQYSATKDALIEEGKKPQNITRSVVNLQKVVEYSAKQGKALQKYLLDSKQGKYKITDIRAGRVNIDWEIINASRNEMKAIGLSNKEIDMFIAKTYFGS